MIDAVAAFAKSLLLSGTRALLLSGVTLGLLLAYGPRRLRRFGLPLIVALVTIYWVAEIPAVAHMLATRFHARDSGQVSMHEVAQARAIVALGAGIRGRYVAAGHVVTEPDRQTILNALEAARIYHLFPEGLPVIASGGGQRGRPEGDTESSIIAEWLVRGGVPADRIIRESESTTTREQALLVAPLLKERHWERFVLVTPAVQLPRAAGVFRAQGVEPIGVSAPFLFEDERKDPPGWVPVNGALRVSERALYDYLAWGYYWLRGWLR